ncbi:TOMM system kinase/cyclase fusion protein [Archangium lipolyticum]|uniref:TOMM system kinase/cyclase fusion protein n=1 Tax=Archangium lipolyticum TaxID=2970465 RepID=UPI00214A099B|nr:TOMM system kinase/cyclase fusion protein [Archangium lipolyticum]
MDEAKRQVIAAALKERYEFLYKLGEGSFGTIFKARQLATGQPVALKVLRVAEDASAEEREKRVGRFEREMQICARMHHPNIVQLIDSGQAEKGLVYTVFEYAPGKNLAQVLEEEGGLEPNEARHLMLQLLDALACAHSMGVIHRDLKPANIMVVPTGARRNALVVDFGIGVLTGEDAPHPHITPTNESIGTPAYAAPEQLRGLPPTPRSDLYAWGLIFLECLTGKRVMEGASAAEVIYKQLSAEPIPFPETLLGHPLGDLLRRATQKEPSARDVTAKELLRELEAIDMSGLASRSGSVERHPALGADTATLEQASPPQDSPPPSERLVQGERRQITALCCKLAASSVADANVDSEEQDQLLGAQQDVCGDIIRRFEGLVAGALGDTMLFYFGYPKARENDAQLAAKAALEISAELGRRAAEIEAQHRVRIEFRLGLHTGMVVARELRDWTSSGSPSGYVVGATPKVATQLCELVRPGNIAVSGETERLLRKHFVLESQGLHPLDGADSPLEFHHLYEENHSKGLSGVPLVGRDKELEILLERWRAAAAGMGQGVLISGEPGIGKSRLVRELQVKLEGQAHTWLECRCTHTSTNSPFYSIGGLLSGLLDSSRDASAEAKVGKLEQMLSHYGFELAEAMPLFAPLLSLPLPQRWPELDVSAQKRRELLHEAILSLFFEIAEKAPVTLVIEDLHWADSSTLELLGQFLAEVGSARVLALFTTRPELTPPWLATVFPLQLGRLGRAEVDHLALQLTHNRPLPPEVLEQLSNRTDGVPLFVEELLRTLTESGVLVERNGAYMLERPLSDVFVPASLRDSLVSRLDHLGRSKETAQVASAIGREFSAELLRAVSPLAEPTLEEDLHKLISAGLIYRRRRLRSSMYVFKHALIRDAAYDTMLKRSRQQVHARIARALAERFPETVSEHPELLAHHHAAADQKRQAIDYTRRAALSALQRAATSQTLAHCRTAMGWLDAIEDPRERAGTELAIIGVLAPALMTAEGYAAPSLGNAFTRARSLCESLEKPPQLFPVLWGLGAFYAVRAEHRTALELGTEVLEMAERQGDPALSVPAHLLNGGTRLWRGEFSASRTHLEESIRKHEPEKHGALADLYSYEPGISTRSYLALTLWFLGYPEQALASSREATRLTAVLNHFHTSVHTLVRSTQLHLLRREGAIALEQAERIIATSVEKGLALWHAQGRILRGWALLESNRAEEGIADMLAGIAGWAETGAEVHRAWSLTVLADAYRQVGRAQEGLAAISEALEVCQKNQDCIYEAESHRLHGELLLALAAPGAEARAEECFARALERARQQQARALELRAAMSAARLWKQRGEEARARRLLQDVLGAFSEGQDTRDLMEAAELLRQL